MIVVKCDICGKILKNFDVNSFKYSIFRSPEDETLCKRCTLDKSNAFKERYLDLLKQYKYLTLKLDKKTTECREYKKKRTEELLSHVKVTIE